MQLSKRKLLTIQAIIDNLISKTCKNKHKEQKPKLCRQNCDDTEWNVTVANQV